MAALVGTEKVVHYSASGGTISSSLANSAAIALLAGATPARTVGSLATGIGTTLTADLLVGGFVTRSGPVAAFTDTLDTAALIIAALHADTPISTTWLFVYRNTTPYPCTLATAAGVTLAGQVIVPANSALMALVAYSGVATVLFTGLFAVPLAPALSAAATALNTVGAGTITAAGIAGGVTSRGGAQSAAAFTDTTDTAANIIAAQPSANVGQSWYWTYRNDTDASATIAGGTGVTVSGTTIVPANSWAVFLATYSGAAAVTLVGIRMGRNTSLPPTKFTSISAGNGTLSAGNIEGAERVVLATSGATAFTTRTAAQIIAGIPNAQVGLSYNLRVFNTNGGTLTLTGGTGVTITGTATIATAKYRDYLVTLTGAAAVTLQNVGSGDAN